MADFVVTIRSKNGSLEERAYTANDRAELFKKLAADGVSAVRVNEGAVGKKPRKAASSGALSKGRGLIAAAIVVLVAVIAAWFMWPEEKKVVEKIEQRKAKAIREEKPRKAARSSIKENNDEPIEKAIVTNYNSKGVWYDEHGRPHYKPARVIHLGSNTVINGKKWISPRRIFKRMSEGELDRVLSARPGDRIIGETNWKAFERDLREALVEPIRIDPEDTPEEIERKEAVREAKKELAKAIGAGESPSEILREAQRDMNKLAELYEGLNQELYRLRTSGEATEEEIEDYVKAANMMLESKNILTRRFHTPAEMRKKAEDARLRKIQLNQQ